MQKYTITTLFLCFMLVATAQEKIQDENPYAARSYEIGLDFQALVRSPILNPLGTNILFKKRLKKKNLFNNLIPCLRLQLGYFSQAEERVNNSTNTNQSNLYSFLGGVEWQQQRKRWQLFYGADIGVELFDFTNKTSSYIEENSTFGIPLTAFIGLKFFIVPQLSIGIESGPTGIFQWQDTNRTLTGINTGTGTGMGTTTFVQARDVQASRIFMTFMRYLSINYHF